MTNEAKVKHELHDTQKVRAAHGGGFPHELRHTQLREKLDEFDDVAMCSSSFDTLLKGERSEEIDDEPAVEVSRKDLCSVLDDVPVIGERCARLSGGSVVGLASIRMRVWMYSCAVCFYAQSAHARARAQKLASRGLELVGGRARSQSQTCR